MNEQDFAELAAGHALDALSPDDARAFETARQEHPEWEHHVTTDAATAALLADGVAEVAPPTGIRAALLARIAGDATPEASVTASAEPVVPPAHVEKNAAAEQATDAPAAPSQALRADRRRAAAAEPAKKPRRWGARSWFALAASLALIVGVGWGAVFVSGLLTPPASVVALDQIESAPDAQSETVELSDGGTATAHWSESVGKAVLVTDGLPAIASDETFQLWFVRDGTAISAGTFVADDGSATALLNGEVEPGDVIAVSVEAEGGSTTGAPTTDPILAIET